MLKQYKHVVTLLQEKEKRKQDEKDNCETKRFAMLLHLQKHITLSDKEISKTKEINEQIKNE